MPKLVGYRCRRCTAEFEFLHVAVTEPVMCPACGAGDVEAQLAGGHCFRVIQATSRTSKKFKAGWVHQYQNRPAEKVSISVPATRGE
jgi:hypothetical protein